MPTYTFDSSVIIAHRVRELPKDFVLSAVVIGELMAGAPDDSARKVYEAVRSECHRDNALITPTTNDSLTTCRIVFSLCRGPERKGGGHAPPRVPCASRRL